MSENINCSPSRAIPTRSSRFAENARPGWNFAGKETVFANTAPATIAISNGLTAEVNRPAISATVAPKAHNATPGTNAATLDHRRTSDEGATAGFSATDFTSRFTHPASLSHHRSGRAISTITAYQIDMNVKFGIACLHDQTVARPHHSRATHRHR